ncbi:MAG: FAD-binding oxidoreductase, partial [Candidatus Thorarchaeota archaeon]
MRIEPLEIEDLVGADNVSHDQKTCIIYSKDVASLPSMAYQIINGRFDVVTQPVDTKSLQRLLKYAQKNRIPIVPRGNGTSGWGGAIPSKGGICVSLARMSRVLNYNEYESTVTVEAGITWRELLTFVERLGSTMPVYPSSATAATIGGFVASGGLGIGSAKYGNILSQVVGVEAILPNGKIVRCGNLIVDEANDPIKEEAEEGRQWLIEQLGEHGANDKAELMCLLLGTYGTIGIITKVTLKTIPTLQLLPFVCAFDTIDNLIDAAALILEEAHPYHIRFMTDDYTSMLSALKGIKEEEGKFILTGALLDTVFNNEDSIEAIGEIVKKTNGIVLGDDRASYYWSERFYPLRIKRHGPSLIPAEMVANIEDLPLILEETKKKLSKSIFAIEGTFGAEGEASFLIWILDDERKKIRFTAGWYRSFEIASLAEKYGGRPYAIALWNARHAEMYYGEETYETLEAIKMTVDPKQVLNPMKVFGGRVQAA